MSEAPERIWAWWDDAYDVGLLNEHGDKRYTPNDAKEYVRADRIEELEAKLRKAVGALGDISNGEPEWPDDPQKELDWCRNRATTALAELTGEQKDG